jgi:putative two-component system response regulator
MGDEISITMTYASRVDLIRALAIAAEARDDEPVQHAERVGRAAAALAELLGLATPAIRLLRAAAPLHDIGKIGIPDSILLKPTSLTPSELEIMQTHTTIGAAILANSDTAELLLAKRIALSHHERWDGSGYPHGLIGEGAPISGRIVAVVEVFDALVHDQPYKQAWSIDEAVGEIAAERGRQFDPDVVDAFLRLDHDQLASGELTASEVS